MKLYVLHIQALGSVANNKGIIGIGKERLIIEARSRNEAYTLACQRFLPEDSRPLAGKGYIRETRLTVGK